MNNQRHIHLDFSTCPFYFKYYLLTLYKINLIVVSPHFHFIDHSSDRSSLINTCCQKPLLGLMNIIDFIYFILKTFFP
jgi:hypothetical protein